MAFCEIEQRTGPVKTFQAEPKEKKRGGKKKK